jgi:hypothetical protein
MRNSRTFLSQILDRWATNGDTLSVTSTNIVENKAVFAVLEVRCPSFAAWCGIGATNKKRLVLKGF